MKTVRDIPDLSGATVLLRTDLDVPVDDNGHITEEFRIIKQKENLNFLVSRGARVIMVAHASDEDAASFRNLLPQFERLLSKEIVFLEKIEDIKNVSGDTGSVYLLDNIRRWPEEEQNDAAFASELVNGVDCYVNNAFSVSHREHASVAAAALLKPAYAGLLVEQEVLALRKVLNAPAQGKVVIMGGAKTSTKVPVIDNLIEKAEHIIVGGVVAIDIMKARGKDIKRSQADANVEQLLESLDVNDPRLVVHEDSIWEHDSIVDIGPKAIKVCQELIARASMVIWNGPMGKFEDERFAVGTKAIAQAIADSDAFSLLGGGDTIAAVHQFGLLDRYDHVSTGGGAMLSFLAGEKLAGLAPLGIYSS